MREIFIQVSVFDMQYPHAQVCRCILGYDLYACWNNSFFLLLFLKLYTWIHMYTHNYVCVVPVYTHTHIQVMYIHFLSAYMALASFFFKLLWFASNCFKRKHAVILLILNWYYISTNLNTNTNLHIHAVMWNSIHVYITSEILVFAWK